MSHPAIEGGVHEGRRRDCLPCKRVYMRRWRVDHPLNAEQRKKDGARSYANVYKRRGKLVPKPCEVCGSSRTEMHHDDYDKPLEVRWFCRRHHLRLHQELDETVKHFSTDAKGNPSKPLVEKL